MHKQYFRDQRRAVPYTVALVDLDAGPRMVAALAYEEATPCCGDRVSLASGAEFVNGMPAFRLGSAERRSDRPLGTAQLTASRLGGGER